MSELEKAARMLEVELNRTRTQRDKLLSVVSDLLANADRVWDVPNYWYVHEKIMQKARDAIAKAESKTP